MLRYARPILLIITLAAASLLAESAAPLAAPATPHPVWQSITVGQSARLNDQWLFHPGDSLAWASPSLNESDWTSYSNQHFLFEYGYRNLTAGWYRKHFRLTSLTPTLSLEISDVWGTYEIYLNGTRIGGNGTIDGSRRIMHSGILAYSVPPGLIPPSGDVTLALRCSFPPTGPIGSSTAAAMDRATTFAFVDSAQAPVDLSYAIAHNAFEPALRALLAGLVAIVAAGLFLAMPKRREYLFATVFLFCATGLYLVDVSDAFSIILARQFLLFMFFGMYYFSLLEFVRVVLQQRRTRLFFAVQIACALSGLVRIVGGLVPALYSYSFFAFHLSVITGSVMLIVLLTRAILRGSLDARFLLPAVILEGASRTITFVGFLLYFFHITSTVPRATFIYLGSYSVRLSDLPDYLFLLGILLFLVLRTVSIAQRNAAVSAELEAARTTQQLILAGSATETPGFRVQASFLPAAELGGDFFLTTLTPSGDLLALIGDVSGKGLTAALRVALILGALRRETSSHPAEILAALNDCLIHQASSGFTTACCLRLTPSGHFTLANAGHIPPYLNGQELPTPPALPLGLIPGATYDELTGTLTPDAQLTLLTDGIPEAQSPSGELFGFDRTAALSRESAETIAERAQQFGQEDDITVLTLTLAPFEVLNA